MAVVCPVDWVEAMGCAKEQSPKDQVGVKKRAGD